MEFEQKLSELSERLESLVNQHSASRNENIQLKKDLTEREREMSGLREEVERLRNEKKEVAKKLDGIIARISQFSEERSNEPLL